MVKDSKKLLRESKSRTKSDTDFKRRKKKAKKRYRVKPTKSGLGDSRIFRITVLTLFVFQLQKVI